MGGVCATLALLGPARAQILTINPDGSVARYAGPVVASPEGIHPLLEQISVPPGAAAPIKTAIADAAARHRLSASLVAAVAWQESRFDPAAVSPKGAHGVMQLMPATAQALGVDGADMRGNIDGGAAYLAALLDRFDGDIVKALAAYNAGPAAVTRYGGVPPYAETKAYVDAVLDRLSMDGATPETRQ